MSKYEYTDCNLENLREQRVVTLTHAEVEAGWHTERCYRCQRVYARLNWYTPSGCSYCNYSFVE